MEKAFGSYKDKSLDYASLMAIFNDLKKYYLEVNYAMNTFDRQNYKESLEKLLVNITEVKKKLEPRKKFKFSRRDEDFGVATQEKDKPQ